MPVVALLRAHDAGLSATRRALRAAIVMPALFALGQALDRPVLATYAAFGALASLLFADFTGPLRDRLAAQATFVLAGGVLVCVGTLAGRNAWLAAAVTLVVGFAVLFAGIVSSVLAASASALLVAFILPVTSPGPASAIPERLGGWVLAGLASLAAITLLWPAPTREPLRAPTARACELIARRLRAEAEWLRGGRTADGAAAVAAAVDAATAAVAALRTSFFGALYRPTGLGTAARALVRLVDQVIWLDAILEHAPGAHPPTPSTDAICDVKLAAAALLEHGAALLQSDDGDPRRIEPDVLRLEAARTALEERVTSLLPDAARVGALEPGFRAQELSTAASAIAANVALTVAARRRSWPQQLLGSQPDGLASPLAAARERAGAHVARHSVWLHNSLRGGVGLAAAVLVAASTGVQHSFWVALGTLAVLRSNALNTGQNALRALAGTTIGFVVGGVLVAAIGTDTAVSWAVLPVAVAFAGLAPAISFTAGQAGFTVTLLVLFDIVAPAGWSTGLVRIEDVAIGVGVALLVGALFWPRGAGAALGGAVADGLADGAAYLRGAVAHGVARCDAAAEPAPAPDEAQRQAAAAARRLDDAFREFLAERGTKHVPLASITTLVTAVAVLRQIGDAVVELWERGDEPPTGDRAAARVHVLDAGERLAGWYAEVANAVAGGAAVPEPPADDALADGLLLDAVRRDLDGGDGRAPATAVRMIWTADYVAAASRLQRATVEPARAIAAVRRSRWAWLRARL